MALVARGTPSFALPATQNTAPVHEFRCLYTHDVRKKAKKWHDGSMRFHTFNKRVMVYDDAKNFIGDLHYRADEEFGEGVELQLDRGVLVEVGERMGETQTDLSGIIHRPHADDTAPASSSNARTRPVQRANHLNNQGKPRSLTELLGASQGRMGRAMLPVTSPFEHRRALLEVQPAEPPSKRQKIGTGKENNATIHQRVQPFHAAEKPVVSGRIMANSIQPKPQPRPISAGRDTNMQAGPKQSVIDISSDEDTQNRGQSAAKTQRNQASVTSVPVECRLSNASSTVRRPVSTPFTIPENRSISRPSLGQQVVPRRSALPPQTSASTCSAPRLKPGMSSLKMIQQKPRRRLVYKALLPSSHVSRDPSPENLVVEIQEASSANQQDQQEELDQMSPTGSHFSLCSAPQTPPRETLPAHISQQQTPLFVSQTGSQQSPTPARMFTEDAFSVLSTQQICDNANPSFDAVSNDAAQAEETGFAEEPESPCFPMPPPKSNPEAQSPLVGKPLLPPKQPLPTPINTTANPRSHQTPSPKKSRQFARSLSANDSPLPHDPRASPSTHTLPPIEESPLIAPYLPQPKQPANQSPARSKSPLQRCRSDTAAIVPTTVAQPVLNATLTEEQGPWTALEAFLLFDKWPMCKEKRKPIFEPLSASGTPEPELDGDDRTGIGVTKGVRNGRSVMIRSARSFMRDGF